MTSSLKLYSQSITQTWWVHLSSTSGRVGKSWFKSSKVFRSTHRWRNIHKIDRCFRHQCRPLMVHQTTTSISLERLVVQQDSIIKWFLNLQQQNRRCFRRSLRQRQFLISSRIKITEWARQDRHKNNLDSFKKMFHQMACLPERIQIHSNG